ncbi:MAG: hypothetical protein II297_03530, partial [Clostridia bacterium]|nr:hypothetical protein [Clostridia bacterium]
SDSTGFACLLRWWRRSLTTRRTVSCYRLWAVVVHSPRALSVAMGACGKNRLLRTRREGSGDRLWAVVVCSLTAVRVAVIDCK